MSGEECQVLLYACYYTPLVSPPLESANKGGAHESAAPPLAGALLMQLTKRATIGAIVREARCEARLRLTNYKSGVKMWLHVA